MKNIILLRIELVFLLLSSVYIIYYLLEKVCLFCFKIKTKLSMINIKYKKTKLKKRTGTRIGIQNEEKTYKQFEWKQELDKTQKEEFIKIKKRIELNLWKSYFDIAKPLIIEWLAFDKFDKDLNLKLAFIYEKEKNFKNAEIIYKDMIKFLENNFEIIKKLGFNLAMQHKFEESMKVYKEAFEKKKSDMEVIDILSSLAYELKKYEESLNYIKIFLKENPRDIEKLIMKWSCLENSWDRKEALNTYKHILEIQPYNTKITEKIKKIKT